MSYNIHQHELVTACGAHWSVASHQEKVRIHPTLRWTSGEGKPNFDLVESIKPLRTPTICKHAFSEGKPNFDSVGSIKLGVPKSFANTRVPC